MLRKLSMHYLTPVFAVCFCVAKTYLNGKHLIFWDGVASGLLAISACHWLDERRTAQRAPERP